MFHHFDRTRHAVSAEVSPKHAARALAIVLALVLGGSAATPAQASSHMDAPLITLDDPANTTDVYAFVTAADGRKYLSTALSVYPFEEPGIGPNNYRFDDAVRYEIHVATGRDLERGRPTYTYRFDFETNFRNQQTIRQAFLDRIENVGDAAQNLVQTYTVTRIDNRRKGRAQVLGKGIVPPNNQGLVTPFYNQGDDGESPAKDGVDRGQPLDRYTDQAIADLRGHLVFAGQRDDAFYADIQAIFDGLALRSGAGELDSFDSQGGFNVHTIAIRIPVESIGGDMQRVGVYATTSRRQITIVSDRGRGDFAGGKFVQVARQGNPLFCEGLVALEDKDLYNRTSPERDRELFAKYADSPELAALINEALFAGDEVAAESGQTDLVGIFIPDLIRVDLSTGPARLAGGGAAHPSNPDDAGFGRLGVFGPGQPDVLQSRLSGGAVPGGWPNGRRFGDDVVDIAVTAILSDLADPNAEPIVTDGIDNVSANEIAFNKVFPYAATPQNGRRHSHH